MSDGCLPIHWLTDTLTDPPPAPPVLVDGLLRAGELCVVGAPRASGKSWLIFNLALLLGRGCGFLFGRLQVAAQARMLLLHGETPRWMAASRWRVLLGHDDPPPAVAEVFKPVHIGVVRVRRQFRSPDGSEAWSEEACEGRLDQRLRRAVAEHKFDVVVLDPWACCYAGSENSNDEVEAALGQLRRLADETGTAVVIVHHLGKAQEGRDPEDLWRGASRLADAASTRCTLLPRFTPQQGKERGLSEAEARRHVKVRILRREEPTPGFTARLGADGWWRRIDDESPAADRSDSSRRVTGEEVALALRLDGGEWPSLGAAAESLGVSALAAAAALDEAKRSGEVVERPGSNGARRFRLSEDSS
ncbi:MAG: AAA family ATPase [Acidimicrobiales bacterium]